MGANPQSPDDGKKGRMWTPPTTSFKGPSKTYFKSFRFFPRLSEKVINIA
jgi:hypothetical protein